MENKVSTYGPTGQYGSNDNGYIHNFVEDAAKSIKRAQEVYSQGHYPHSNAKIVEPDNKLRLVMDLLKLLDDEYCKYANKTTNPELFSTYNPPYEDTIRWDRLENEDGKKY